MTLYRNACTNFGEKTAKKKQATRNVMTKNTTNHLELLSFGRSIPTPSFILPSKSRIAVLRWKFPTDVKPHDLLLDPLLVKTLGLENPEFPFDFHTPQLEETSRSDLPLIWIYFPSKAQMIQHRVALHKYTRKKLSNRYEDELHLDDANAVSFVINAQGRISLYAQIRLCEGTVSSEWRCVSRSFQKLARNSGLAGFTGSGLVGVHVVRRQRSLFCNFQRRGSWTFHRRGSRSW